MKVFILKELSNPVGVCTTLISSSGAEGYSRWTIGGAVVVEAIFSWPGMGNLLYRSILMQDFPVVMFIIFIISILTVISNIIGDILTAILDPRVSLKG